MTRLPAHAGLDPRPFQYLHYTGIHARLIGERTGAVGVERATHTALAPLGYYRLTSGGKRESWFCRVVHAAQAECLASASRLAHEAALCGVPAPRFLCGPVSLGQEYALFVYEWIDGSFFRGRRSEVLSLGRGLAELHRFLRARTGAEHRYASEVTWVRRWSALERLTGDRRVPDQAARMLANFVSRRDEILIRLTSSAQLLHDDLHIGNVLFDVRGHVSAFLDFEEALLSAGSCWIDLAWIVERFCLLGPRRDCAEVLARCFLRTYFLNSPCRVPELGTLQDAILWRNFHALSILADQAESPAWRGEWAKFVGNVLATPAWAPLLARLERASGFAL